MIFIVNMIRYKLKHKFNATRTECNGIKFPSKKEANEYKKLQILKESGEILFFLRQVPIHLPGNIIYRVDFLIFWANGECEFREVKGVMTEAAQIKISQAMDLYNIDIHVV